YTTSNGTLAIRNAVADYVLKTRGVPVDPEEVIVMPGGKPVMFAAAFTLLDSSTEAIVPDPSYPIYESASKVMGAVVKPLPILEEKGFSFDHEVFKHLVSNKTKLVFVNTPANPTGGVLSKEDLKLVRDLAVEKNFWVLSDEIYSRIVYDGKHESILNMDGMKERTILLDGWSKTYSMTGWRLGYGVMPKELASHFATAAINMYSCVTNFCQDGGIEALTGPQDDVDKMVKTFKERRDFIVKGLNEIEGVSCIMPKGAFYAFPNVKKICAKSGKNSKQLESYLLENGLACLAGSAFGSFGEGYLRFSYAASKEDIAAGLEIMRSAFEKL
ncbi:MAG TPA: aminotransferase class I/II-fold pyridoxal phosphate-dependent enzyme, partial [Candidatus Norongarragalinales archaeon]|nr:aminotransferase class I/II-fold pyridoxal phosphate-dependent enzyme [Candidatus Norongarragalinales archaeon]